MYFSCEMRAGYDEILGPSVYNNYSGTAEEK